jgi:RNA polymerase sigma factor (sigma-70 family)
MNRALSIDAMADEQDRRISDAVQKDGPRLRNFIRARVADPLDAEDILHDVFYELVEAYRLMQPIEQAGAWMFRVARNRIIDLFRKKKPQSLAQPSGESENANTLEDLLPSPDAGPDAEYARSLLIDELEDALDELPEEQREVFIAHEIEGRSFKEISAETGIGVNTLLSRKRYAVLHLRQRLQSIYDEFLKG